MLNSNGRYYRFSKALVFDFSKSAKNKCSRKTVIKTVWVKDFQWQIDMIIWHYSANRTENFKKKSLFFIVLEQFSRVKFFLGHPLDYVIL